MRELTTARPRFGCERLHMLLTRAGWMVGRSKVHRLCKLEGLRARQSSPQEALQSAPGTAPSALAAGQYWAMDFVHDQLTNGRRSRVLTIIDKWHRQSVTMQVNLSLTGQSVVDALKKVALDRALLIAITVDHGPKFTSKALDECCYLRGVKFDFVRPVKPTEIGMIESFNG